MKKHLTGISLIHSSVWEKCLFCILLMSFSYWLEAQERLSNPFSLLKYDSVVLYDYEGSKGMFLLDEQNNLNIAIIKKQVYFNKAETVLFNKKLGQTRSYGEGEASCFDPHFGVVYYFHHKRVAYIEICLACNRLSPSMRLVAQEQKPQGKGTERYFLGGGMSKSFRKYINGILVRYHFSHQIKPG